MKHRDMKNEYTHNFYMAIIMLIMVVTIIIFSNNTDEREEMANQIKIALEKAYFEGQKDALEGKIRIHKVGSGNYTWIQSPWDDNSSISFVPPQK